ncbi:unnamed protein product [Blepharisma stoltei]|uniref:PUB domain-containing protein n=1 Tax=Blepharisma stoltei TaxID=1481888 RepID=A0AAU9K5A7_9CILI|nr:unnamed protein product [Blepharisma stoltei]
MQILCKNIVNKKTLVLQPRRYFINMESEDLDTQIYHRLQQLIQENGPNNAQNGILILIKLLQNISEHPEEAKFRSIKKTNKAIQTKLLSLRNINDILYLIGYRDNGPDYEFSSAVEILDIALPIIEVTSSEINELLKSEEEKERERQQRAIREEMKAKEEAKKRLLDQARLDRKETNTHLLPTQDSKPQAKGCGKKATWNDIGVDLNKKGGWR